MRFENINPTTIQGQLFGLPITPEKAQIICMPAPWAVSHTDTTTLLGPESLLRNSSKISLHQESYPDAWRLGITMLPMPNGWKLKSTQLNHSAKTYLQAREAGSNIINTQLTARIDQYTLAFKQRIKNKALIHLNQGKMVTLIGGEQTCALGLIEACAETHPTFGILHIDAHADLQQNHHGLTYAHTTVMHHALQIPQVHNIVQVALRDYTPQEALTIQQNQDKITPFTDQQLKEALYKGTPWHQLCQKIISTLPSKIYISIDIDALQPTLCPSTTRPTPGGLNTTQLTYLIHQIVKAQKQIIAFDISEIAFNGETELDGLIASHLLYKIATLMAVSQGKL